MYINLNELLHKHNCIYKKVIRLKSGMSSDIYYDLKKAAGIPEIFCFVVDELKKIIPNYSNIACVATGAISYGAAVAYLTKSNFAYVRPVAKEHGTKRIIEGKLNHKKPVYLIEDVCTTGSSIDTATEILLSQGYNNIVKICILNRDPKRNLNIISIEKLT